ncbi:MAG: class I SAM-dependent methyltransferase [Phycisphaerales bacterium]
MTTATAPASIIDPPPAPLTPIPYHDPTTGEQLTRDGLQLVRNVGDSPAATIRDGVADFIGGDSYAQSFGYQWNRTEAVRTQDTTLLERHREEMDLRTGFNQMDLRGMTCLEVGAGLGDDTAYYLEQGIGELHAIDLSASIFRAAKLIDDPRVRYARADVNKLPFAPESFDIVSCHRMMQHTPHPAATLARVAKMVKPGGLLFAHSYHRSKYFERTSKYKYRWLTTRVPSPLLWNALAISAPVLRGVTAKLNRTKLFSGRLDGEEFARRWSPWVTQGHHMIKDVDRKTLLQYETQVTFDALTPKYDLPMYADDFQDLIESMGFEIINIERRPWFPLWATARRTRSQA